MSGQCYSGDGTGYDDQPRTTLRGVVAPSSSPKPSPSIDPDNPESWRHLFDCCQVGCGLDERATYTYRSSTWATAGSASSAPCGATAGRAGSTWRLPRGAGFDCPCSDCWEEYGAEHALCGQPPLFKEFSDLDDLPVGDEPQCSFGHWPTALTSCGVLST